MPGASTPSSLLTRTRMGVRSFPRNASAHDSGCATAGLRTTPALRRLGLRHAQTPRRCTRGHAGRRRGIVPRGDRPRRCAHCRRRRRHHASRNRVHCHAWPRATRRRRATNSAGRSIADRWKPATRSAIAAMKYRRACCSGYARGEYSAQDEIDLHAQRCRAGRSAAAWILEGCAAGGVWLRADRARQGPAIPTAACRC